MRPRASAPPVSAKPAWAMPALIGAGLTMRTARDGLCLRSCHARRRDRATATSVADARRGAAGVQGGVCKAVCARRRVAFVLVVAVVVAVAAVHGDRGPGRRACLCLDAGVYVGFRRLGGDAIRRRDSAKSPLVFGPCRYRCRS